MNRKCVSFTINIKYPSLITPSLKLSYISSVNKPHTQSPSRSGSIFAPSQTRPSFIRVSCLPYKSTPTLTTWWIQTTHPTFVLSTLASPQTLSPLGTEPSQCVGAPTMAKSTLSVVTKTGCVLERVLCDRRSMQRPVCLNPFTRLLRRVGRIRLPLIMSWNCSS